MLSPCLLNVRHIGISLRQILKKHNSSVTSLQKCTWKLSASIGSVSQIKENDITKLNSSGVEVWDLNYISSNFTGQIKSASLGYYKAIALGYLSKQKNHLEKLR